MVPQAPSPDDQHQPPATAPAQETLGGMFSMFAAALRPPPQPRQWSNEAIDQALRSDFPSLMANIAGWAQLTRASLQREDAGKPWPLAPCRHLLADLPAEALAQASLFIHTKTTLMADDAWKRTYPIVVGAFTTSTGRRFLMAAYSYLVPYAFLFEIEQASTMPLADLEKGTASLALYYQATFGLVA